MNLLKLGVTFVKSLSALFVPCKCPKRIDNEKIVAGESLASDSTPSDIIGYQKAQQPHYDLLRFLDAQEVAYTQALSEILGDRLRECCKALLLHKGKDIKYIMGSGIDVLKLKTSMCLFNKVSPNDVFEEVLDAFF